MPEIKELNQEAGLGNAISTEQHVNCNSESYHDSLSECLIPK